MRTGVVRASLRRLSGIWTRQRRRSSVCRKLAQMQTKLDTSKPVIFCGVLNVAYTDLDLSNPKSHLRAHGFTAEERAGFSALVESGFMDTFREFEKGGGHYTWWNPMAGARQQNFGWRI